MLQEHMEVRKMPNVQIVGTGIDVWEIVAVYKSVGEDFGRLRKAYHWLTDQQLRSAIGYYSAFPEEIDELLRRNEEWTPERIQSMYPHLAAGKQ